MNSTASVFHRKSLCGAAINFQGGLQSSDVNELRPAMILHVAKQAREMLNQQTVCTGVLTCTTL